MGATVCPPAHDESTRTGGRRKEKRIRVAIIGPAVNRYAREAFLNKARFPEKGEKFNLGGKGW